MNLASIKHQWPIGRGFERFYGFLGAETNQWYPDLVYDNHPVEQPALPEDGYHFTTDITDKALEFIRDAKAIAPDKPFFLYYCARGRPRAAPRAQGVDREVRRQVRHGLRGVPRASSSSVRRRWASARRRRALADQSVPRREEPRRQAVAGARHRPPVGLAVRGRAAPLRAHGRGVRRLPEPRRPRDRPAARPPRGDRRARQHHRRARLRQRRVGRGRTRTARSTRTSSSTGCPTRSRRTCRTSTTSAARRPTTTTRPAGRGRSTRRSRCGSATATTRAAPPTR